MTAPEQQTSNQLEPRKARLLRSQLKALVPARRLLAAITGSAGAVGKPGLVAPTILLMAALSARCAAAGPELAFTVTEWAGVARTNEIVCSGVPLPRESQAFSVDQLRVTTADGQAVPACFHTLARWNAGRLDTKAPLQWVLIEMPASTPALGSRSFRLVVSNSPAPPVPFAAKLTLTQTNNEIRVNTGTATFTLGRNANLLFDEIRLADGTLVATGQPLTATADSNHTTHAVLRRVVVERVSDLAATVVVDGAYDLPAVGGGGLAASRRYQFFAGSATALVRHEVAWEGSRFSVGVLAEDGVPNGVRLQQVRDALAVPWAGLRQAWIWGAEDTPTVQASGLGAEAVWLEQKLRARHTDPFRYEIGWGTNRQSGRVATGGMLACSDATKTVALALYQMHHYEPQALRGLADGTMAVDLASDSAWLGARQGMFANFGVCVATGQVAAAALKASLWAKLNHPLRAWPSAVWFAGSKATEEFPVGTLAPQWQAYDTLVRTVLTRTTNLLAEMGLPGLQTYGLFPRYWGNPGGYNEITSSPDVTPDETWDDTYWGATWTDYHNTSALATYWAMRSGESWWLDEISAPAAWRMLHTQIIHGAPGDDYFYIGQAPTGYGGYRADFNSSHAYFDNLLLHYWLTGDLTIVETVQRGAATMRQFMYPERPGVPCDPLRPPPNEWAHPVGRVASQWIQAFRFVGLASDDASFLEDFRGNLSRAVAQYYAELTRAGERFGFWCDAPVSEPGTNHTDQTWMLTLYDMNNLNRWRMDSGDAPLGLPALRPSEVLSAWGRTLTYLAPVAAPEGDGTAQGQWPNYLQFTWNGDRVGGPLLGVTNFINPAADPILWNSGKAAISANVSRAADWLGDPTVRRMGEDLAALALNASWNQGEPPPLGKEQGLYLSRLSAAVARLNAAVFRRLEVSRQGDRIGLSWPDANQSGRLEMTHDLASASWETVTNLWQTTNVWVEIAPERQAFFRLSVPD